MFGLFGDSNWTNLSDVNAQKVIDVLEDWFNAMQAGHANNRMPDEGGHRFTEQECDRLIEMIDEYFEDQLLKTPTYWVQVGNHTRGVPIELGPDFKRIQGTAREALAQDLYRVCEEVAPDVKASLEACQQPFMFSDYMGWQSG